MKNAFALVVVAASFLYFVALEPQATKYKKI
jgi:hypothetical protein